MSHYILCGTFSYGSSLFDAALSYARLQTIWRIRCSNIAPGQGGLLQSSSPDTGQDVWENGGRHEPDQDLWEFGVRNMRNYILGKDEGLST